MKLIIITYFIVIVTINFNSGQCDSIKISEHFKNNLKEISGKAAIGIAKAFHTYNETGVMPSSYIEFSRQIELSPDIKKLDITKLAFKDQSILCIACRSAVKVAFDFVRNSSEDKSDEFKKTAVELCVYFKIQPRHVCQGLVDFNWPVLDYILRHHESELDEETLCGVLMQGSKCGNTNPKFDWSLRIDSNYRKILSHKKFSTDLNSKKLKILHLTDIHYDPSYIVGGKANCEEPLCCRAPLDSNETNAIGAGKWSDYRDCDVPWDLYTNTIDQIKKHHKDFDLIYFTGDVIDHGVWDTSKEGNKESIRDIYRYMKKTFGNVPIFPILGNHEPHPLNLYAPEDVKREDLSTQWLYDLIADEWKTWLPESTAQETIRKEGYYTVTPRKGFRIIALNNNNAYIYNFWLLYKPTYLAKQLQWMHDVLLESEAANEYVHILMHIPSGEPSCFNTWSREFRRIVERFHHIIGGIFVGHTHFDEFNLHYSIENPQFAINIAWNGGSLTPFSNVNPNYRTYEIETSTYQVAKHETWIFNLTMANMNPQKSPIWFKEYSFKDAYGLNDLSPYSINQLIEKFVRDKSLLKNYWEYKVKLGDPSLNKGCDNVCLLKHLCESVTTQSNDKQKCIEFKRKYLMQNLINIF